MSKLLLGDDILVFLLGYALLYVIWEVFNKSPLLKVWKRGKKRSKLSSLSPLSSDKRESYFEIDFGVYVERESSLSLKIGLGYGKRLLYMLMLHSWRGFLNYEAYMW